MEPIALLRDEWPKFNTRASEGAFQHRWVLGFSHIVAIEKIWVGRLDSKTHQEAVI